MTVGGIYDVITGKGHGHRPTVGRWGRALHAFTPREAATEGRRNAPLSCTSFSVAAVAWHQGRIASDEGRKTWACSSAEIFTYYESASSVAACYPAQFWTAKTGMWRDKDLPNLANGAFKLRSWQFFQMKRSSLALTVSLSLLRIAMVPAAFLGRTSH